MLQSSGNAPTHHNIVLSIVVDFNFTRTQHNMRGYVGCSPKLQLQTCRLLAEDIKAIQALRLCNSYLRDTVDENLYELAIIYSRDSSYHDTSDGVVGVTNSFRWKHLKSLGFYYLDERYPSTIRMTKSRRAYVFISSIFEAFAMFQELESLTLDCVRNYSIYFKRGWPALTALEGKEEAFPSLKKLKLDINNRDKYDYVEGGPAPELILQFAKAPFVSRLESLDITMPACTEVKQLLEACKSLTKLRLDCGENYARVKHEYLVVFENPSVLTNLQSLEFRAHCSKEVGDAFSRAIFPALQRLALEPARIEPAFFSDWHEASWLSTLKELDISNDCISSAPLDDLFDCKFAKLEKLWLEVAIVSEEDINELSDGSHETSYFVSKYDSFPALRDISFKSSTVFKPECEIFPVLRDTVFKPDALIGLRNFTALESLCIVLADRADDSLQHLKGNFPQLRRLELSSTYMGDDLTMEGCKQWLYAQAGKMPKLQQCTVFMNAVDADLVLEENAPGILRGGVKVQGFQALKTMFEVSNEVHGIE